MRKVYERNYTGDRVVIEAGKVIESNFELAPVGSKADVKMLTALCFKLHKTTAQYNVWGKDVSKNGGKF